MAAPTYGSYQPGAVDPWPIESVLAKEAITSPADAQGMLSSYAQQRQAQGYSYGQQAEQQHEFAKQQLAQQMVEARLKAIPEFLARGQAGAELIAPGAGLGLGDTLTPDAAARSLQASRTGEFAKNFAEQGKGAESFSRAGQDVALQQIPGLQNLRTTGAGEHSDISVERIKADTALKTAAMHAKAKGGAAEGSYSAQLPGSPGGLTLSARSAKNEPYEHFVARMRAAQPSFNDVAPPSEGPSPATPSGALQRRNAGAAAASVPDAGRVANAAPGADPIQRSVRSHLENVVRTQNPAAYADIMAKAKMNGGVVQLNRDARGQPVVQGVRGTYQ